ncbi:MAG: esterase-like activity of phytase family protein [Thermoanaerobaculales bacterium]|nr:esterase-like activity of phytase family protein [Thermoanaerobaculales bacterium]
MVRWHADEPFFAQNFAIEASGLAASDRFLWVSSEKYGGLLLVDLLGRSYVKTVRVGVPKHAELEGVALVDGGVLLCDEAHAAVYEVAIENEHQAFESPPAKPLPAVALTLEGVGVRGGKIGFEGIEVDEKDGTVYLLLERSGTEETGCVSRIWKLHRSANALRAEGDPVEVALEDCTWRLTGLAWWNEQMIALKTKFPGMRYEVVTVDLQTGDTTVLLDPTKLLRLLAREGWSNNVEGIAVSGDGSLWLVADNAVTGVIDDPLPPPGKSHTLLLRIPPTSPVSP